MSAEENPFSIQCLERAAFHFPQGVDWHWLLARAEAQQWCGSIVGGAGSGKSTLLRGFVPYLEARGFQPIIFHLATESSMKEKDRLAGKLREIHSPAFILLDGAEQLSTRQWLPIRTAASQAAGFIVTLQRSSRLPILLELEASPRLLDQIVESLAGGKLPEGEAEMIFARHRGHLRHCFSELQSRWTG